MVIPISLKEANDFVTNFHRHNGRTSRDGGKFAIGAACLKDENEGLVGVAIVGRPLSRILAEDSFTAEVLRCCVSPQAPKNSCSFLYGHCWRVWEAMGGRRLITYTLASESGSSLKGAGWTQKAIVKPRQKGWERNDACIRQWQPIYGQLKLRWEKTL